MPKEYMGVVTRRINCGWVLAPNLNTDATVMILVDSALDIPGEYLKSDML
jgi:hypothetical protein